MPCDWASTLSGQIAAHLWVVFGAVVFGIVLGWVGCMVWTR